MARTKKETIENNEEEVVEKKTTKTTKKASTTKKTGASKVGNKIEKEKEKKLSAMEQRKLDRQKRRELSKKINDDLGVHIYCLAGNTTLYVPRANSKEIRTMKYGDSAWFTVEDLKMINTDHPLMLSEKYIIPTEIDSDEVTLVDVLKNLGIDHYYDLDEEGESECLFEDTIDFVLNDLSDTEFEDFLNTCDEGLAKRIFDRAVELYIKDDFDSSKKKRILEKRFNSKNIFEDTLEDREKFPING